MSVGHCQLTVSPACTHVTLLIRRVAHLATVVLDGFFAQLAVILTPAKHVS